MKLWNKNKTFVLKEIISPDLILRDLATDLFKNIKKAKNEAVVVDFKGIESISRSFAQEYLIQKKICVKNIKEINMSVNIKKMIDVVHNSKPNQQLSLKFIPTVF